MSVDTTKVTNRRRLHFESIGDIGADVERLAKGTPTALGNWSPGQIYQHLAQVMIFSLDGFPFTLPLPIRLFGRMVKRRTLTRGMTPGLKLPLRAAPLLPPPVMTEEGLSTIRTAISRHQTETERIPAHPFFGPMTRDDWNELHCRHAELHMSFLIPAD